MGKRLKTQRRGKGTPRYKAPSHRFRSTGKYREEEMAGLVTNFTKDQSKHSLLMNIKWEDGTKTTYIAPEGIRVNSEIKQGGKDLAIGNILKLSDIPEGIPIFNIEKAPGDGGKLVRTTGTSATIVARQKDKIIIKLPSKRMLPLKENCRATIGITAGGGRPDKPLVKAGKNYFKKKAKGQKYPVVRGVAMNPVNHPHGGCQHHTGKASTVKRNTPPGRKVGHIAARRTGRKKRK